MKKIKVFKVGHLRKFEQQIAKGEISYTKMIENLNDMAYEMYNSENNTIMMKRNNELIFDVGKNKQLTLTGYDWRQAILNWTINGSKPIYYVSFELFRFKISWQYFGGI